MTDPSFTRRIPDPRQTALRRGSSAPARHQRAALLAMEAAMGGDFGGRARNGFRLFGSVPPVAATPPSRHRYGAGTRPRERRVARIGRPSGHGIRRRPLGVGGATSPWFCAINMFERPALLLRGQLVLPHGRSGGLI